VNRTALEKAQVGVCGDSDELPASVTTRNVLAPRDSFQLTSSPHTQPYFHKPLFLQPIS